MLETYFLNDTTLDVDAFILECQNNPSKIKFSREVRIDPPKAREILAKLSKHNRPISKARVLSYKNKMLARTWDENSPEALMFDYNSKLHNAYHRLNGLSEIKDDDFYVNFYVTFNCDPNSPTDNNKPRNLTDEFVRAGGLVTKEAPPNKITSIAARILAGITDTGTKTVSQSEIIVFGRQHEQLFVEIYKIAKKYGNAGRYNAGWVAAFAKASLAHGFDKVKPLLERFVSQSWEDEKDPLKRLHLFLDRNGNKTIRDYILYPYAVSAIRSALDGRKITCLWKTSEDFKIYLDVV